MANDFFQDDGNPAYGGSLSSQAIRTLFANIELGFDKLPGLTGNGSKIIAVNAGATALEAVTTTGTGNAVRATSAAVGGTWTAASAWTLPAYTLGGTVTLNGQSFSGTCANGGTFATIDINGGTVDGSVIGGASPAAGTFTSLSAITFTVPSGTGSTTEGVMQWSTAGDLLTVGTGAATKTMVDTNSTQTLSGKTLSSPTFTTPDLGTPASGTLTNCTGLPISTGVSGLGTGVATALAVNVGSAGAPVVNGGALGTPSTGTLTSCIGLPISTGVSGLGVGVVTFLATPSSANLASAITDETGSGSLVFSNAPTLVTPALGTPASGDLRNCSMAVAPAIGATTPNTASFTTLKCNNGYGSVADFFGCRAWVNFNGTGTPAIRAGGNVTSITDNGVGDYTVNFTSSMPDANYSMEGSASVDGGTQVLVSDAGTASHLTTSCRINVHTTGAFADKAIVSASFHR